MRVTWSLALAGAVLAASGYGAHHAASGCATHPYLVASHRADYEDGAFGPVWSPDGTRVAFSYEDPVEASDAEYVADVATGNGRLVARGAAVGQWAPDGNRLVVSREEDIAIAQADGSRTHRLVQGALNPVWSPDGCWIAYTAGTNGGAAIAHPDGTSAHSFNAGAGLGDPAWSADSRRLALSDGDIWTVDVPAGTPRRLIHPPGIALDPVWSPDGTKIAYVMAPSQEDTFFDDYPGGTLYVVDVATGAARRLTAGTAPVWSPSGDQIAYMHTDGCSKSWIGTIHSDGTGLRHVTDGHYDKYPAWSPNGKRLAYRHATTITGCYTIGAIWHVAADGSDAKPLIPATAVAAPKHSLVGMRAGAARSILRPLGRHARVVGPDGTPAPAEWTVCLERQSSGPLGPELLAIVTPICPFRAPRLIGMSYTKAGRVISSIGALEDDDSSDPNYTKADIATNWTVCVQDPVAGARIPLSTTRQPMISIGLAPTCR